MSTIETILSVLMVLTIGLFAVSMSIHAIISWLEFRKDYKEYKLRKHNITDLQKQVDTLKVKVRNLENKQI